MGSRIIFCSYLCYKYNLIDVKKIIINTEKESFIYLLNKSWFIGDFGVDERSVADYFITWMQVVGSSTLKLQELTC